MQVSQSWDWIRLFSAKEGLCLPTNTEATKMTVWKEGNMQNHRADSRQELRGFIATRALCSFRIKYAFECTPSSGNSDSVNYVNSSEIKLAVISQTKLSLDLKSQHSRYQKKRANKWYKLLHICWLPFWQELSEMPQCRFLTRLYKKHVNTSIWNMNSSLVKFSSSIARLSPLSINIHKHQLVMWCLHYYGDMSIIFPVNKRHH